MIMSVVSVGKVNGMLLLTPHYVATSKGENECASPYPERPCQVCSSQILCTAMHSKYLSDPVIVVHEIEGRTSGSRLWD